MRTDHRRTEFRDLLARDTLTVAPGAYDAITARLIEQAGFELVYMTGAGVSLSRGYPDYGLLTMSEMVDSARIMAGAVAVPVLADADTGYGNELNVTRTVRAYEDAGIAGIHIEDQVSPKRCGHLTGKETVGRDQFLSTIRAAVEARRDDDFVIVARTDAIATDGFDEAVARANGALDAGADVAFVEAPTTADEVAAVPAAVHGPCLFNVVVGGRSPVVELGHVEQLGYRLAIVPGVLLGTTVVAGDRALAGLDARLPRPYGAAGASPAAGVADFFARFGGREWDAIRARFGDGAP